MASQRAQMGASSTSGSAPELPNVTDMITTARSAAAVHPAARHVTRPSTYPAPQCARHDRMAHAASLAASAAEPSTRAVESTSSGLRMFTFTDARLRRHTASMTPTCAPATPAETITSACAVALAVTRRASTKWSAILEQPSDAAYCGGV